MLSPGTGKYESYPAADCAIVAAAPGHCSCIPAAFAPMLDWLDVEMGDMLSSVSVGVDRLSYDEGLLEVFPL